MHAEKMCVWYLKLLPWNEFSTMTRRRMYLDLVAGLLWYWKSGIWNWSLAIGMWVYDVDWFIVRHWVRGLFFFRYLSCLISWHLNCFFLPAFHENPFNFVAISYIAICYLCYNLLRRVIICLECGIHHTPSPIPSSIPFNFISFLFLVLTQTQRIWNFAPSN